MDQEYTRHTFTLILDVPGALASDPGRMADVLNAAVSRITELIDDDPKLQALLRGHGIELGWEAGSWES
ncbi:MAG TPA: hypothetical protein VNL77_19860 [Roseiflexaceae bacterium]|nr:hypothetical protein [Roseiflexaceae bacterium]